MDNSSQTTGSSMKKFTKDPMVILFLGGGLLALLIRIVFTIFPNAFEVVVPYVFLICSITCVIGAVYYYKQRKFIMTTLFIICTFVSILMILDKSM